MKAAVAILTLVLSLVLVSCRKDPETVPEGRVRLLVSVDHHGFPISNAVVFLKNGTIVFPGQDTTLYDRRYEADENGKLIIDSIGNGDRKLVLYAKGFDPVWDTSIITPVWGYQFSSFTTGIGESRDISVQVPVSE